MPIIRQFVRHASVEIMRDYFSRKRPPVDGVDWTQDRSTLLHTLTQWVDTFTPEERVRLRVDMERVQQMSDEVGQAALLGAVRDVTKLKSLPSAQDRSLWTYLHESESFRHAEDIRYADQYRHGRNWSGYQVETGLRLRSDEMSLEVFKDRVRSLFGLGEKVKVDMFQRVLAAEDGGQSQVFQIMVYQEGLPDSYLEFEGENDIVSRIRRPISEHAIIYCESNGAVEVVAAKAERRDAIARAFTEALLARGVEAERTPLRRYDLEPLMANQTLTWDASDGIESVHLVMLKLKDLAGLGRLQIETPAKSIMGLHEYAQEYFSEHSPLTSGGFVPTQAKLVIRFHPDNGSARSKTLPVRITLPNGCDLRSRTDKERLIGEKYLKRWGLLNDIHG
ncbi:conserved hypothetical protein [Hahella chejuensis KCTC 2396]|uniref:Uncharacterized protein n=1 Tax=Hahella chejuensis (strain KCTC 2396) TaxID=349521 RepID=Q2SAP8_HAHCH|nr:hypothetical protein [Hahella chejuensis]ABC32276.1 conserved hypothetical protein [Hahella chejuensis KCTC 2396]